ncbi:hypothetical protein [Niabella ginsengisoli]|uniref:Peptidase M56 domain-containing protein n=1 Tax=Niabella ginsengisoli TaxID=522298 RepID=A0ABS9SK15_9BACT|nr:hypothetical protein [Niabella ginsengisoli]MCH5598711.1 hypothetical protein [Niabella ginsengisoli]
MIAYLLQMVICSGILYGYYHFFLRNEKFHQYNRFYLLAIVLLSLLLPIFKIQVYFEDNSDIIYQSLGSLNESIIVVSKKAETNWLNLTSAVYLIYTAITVFFITRIIAALRKILQIKSEGSITQTDGIIFINTTNKEAPFSFFKWLFWNKNISLNSNEGGHIFRHEMYHIQKSTVTILYLQK